MKKLVSIAVVALIYILPMIVTPDVEARSTYGNNVDATCLDSDPFNGNCSLCHVSDRGILTKEMQGYLNEGPCYFCPNDTVCVAAPIDQDGDGYASDVDCNDLDASVYPGAVEICDDGVDNDCNGLADAADPSCPAICTDLDGDGFSVEGGACGAIDCDDNDPDVYPGATEICNDGIDQDCSGRDRTKGKICGSTKVASEGKGKTCTDGLDNDQDGLTDCADPDCSRSRACR